MKKKLIVLLILLIYIPSIFASSLFLLRLEDASLEQLVLMSEVRNLPTEGTKAELISSLKKTINESEKEEDITVINEIEKDEEVELSSFFLTIDKADFLYKTGGEKPLIILEGDTQVSFKLKETDKNQTLSASEIVLDLNSSKLTALGNISYINEGEEKDESIQNIDGEIITLSFKDDEIIVTGGTIFSKRKNSENEEITFSASSSLLKYNKKNTAIILDDGYITTNKETSYSSISASKLALLPNGDMFLKDAFISIGRVPVLYLPYFFSPGARMIGNPSIGFEINRGMFVNTTFEIFGTYPSFKKTKQSSFSTLLSSSSKPSNVSPGSSIYTESENLTDLQKWAQSTNSYFALIFDAYEKTPYYSESFSTLNDNRGSSVFGYSLNLNLFKDILKIESNTMISLASEGNKNGIEKYNQYSIFRYDGLLNLTLNSKTTSLKIKLPYLSDPKVKKTYSNRLSTFSLDSLWNRNQTFPSSYSSDINFYKWEVEGKYKLPINSKGNFLDYFEISSFEANILSKWKKVDGFYKYAFDSYTLPKFSSKFGGTIFEKNFSEEDELKDSSNEESEKTFDIKLLEKQGLSNFSFSKLAKEFLEKEENTSYKSIIGDVDRLTLSNENEKKVEGIIQLNYDIKDDFYYRTNNLNESNEESELYNKSNLNVLFSSNVFNNNLDIISNLNITNFYKVNNDLKIKTIIKNTNSIKFPQLNFSYFIDLKYFENSYEKTTVEKNDIDYFNFDIDHVSKHSIQWSKKYDFSTYSLVPTLSYILPPLKTILKPSLRYVGSVIDDTISADLDFNSSFYLKSISNKFNLNMGDFLFSLDGKYDFSKNTNSSKFFDPYSLSMLFRYNNKENKISISQFLNYKGISDVGVRNSFSSIKTFFDSKILDSELNISTFENNLSLDYWKNTVKIVDYQNYWWKNRMGIKFSFDSTFNFSFREKYSTYLKLKTDFSFGIAKFLFLDISFTTSNHGFYRYYVGDDFKFSLMMEDLLRSFDFFGNGRHNTQFNLEDVSIDLVHKMEDWDLHCKYKGTVVLSNYTYKWVPTLSIFLQWKTIPELKIENSFSTNSDGSWVRSN